MARSLLKVRRELIFFISLFLFVSLGELTLEKVDEFFLLLIVSFQTPQFFSFLLVGVLGGFLFILLELGLEGGDLTSEGVLHFRTEVYD